MAIDECQSAMLAGAQRHFTVGCDPGNHGLFTWYNSKGCANTTKGPAGLPCVALFPRSS